MRGLSDRRLAEFSIVLSVCFFFVGVAGVGVTIIWPDQKGLGIAVLIAAAVCFAPALAITIATYRGRRLSMGMTMVWAGMALILCGAVLGMVGAMKTDDAAVPKEYPLHVWGVPQPREYFEGTNVVGLPWTKGLAHVVILFQNDGAEIITDLDVIIRTDRFILRSSAQSSVASPRIGPMSSGSGRLIVHAEDPTTGKLAAISGGHPSPDNLMLTQDHRLYCDKLAARSEIGVELLTAMPAPNFPNTAAFVDVDGAPPTQAEMSVRFQVDGERFEMVSHLWIVFLP